MKIEICEQMIASWLQHIKGCQIVQTNWSPSPCSEIADEDINAVANFVADINNYLGEEDIDIFKKLTMRQLVMQCEIDVVGIHIVDGTVGDLYLVDSAFHENGLNYNNVVAVVIKKLLRAALVSSIVFPGVPANIIFASPKCGDTLKKQLAEKLNELDSIIKHYYPDIDIVMLFNEEFAQTVYAPITEIIGSVNNDNDLFIRSMKLAHLSEAYKEKNTAAPATVLKMTSLESKTPRGQNKSKVFSTLQKIIAAGKMDSTMLSNLCDPDFCNREFNMPTFPVLVQNTEFPASGYENSRFYSPEMIYINDLPYRVCSQWIPQRMRRLETWAGKLFSNE